MRRVVPNPAAGLGGLGCVLLAAACLLLFARCDLVEPGDEQQLVVEAFFVSGEPLAPLTLRATRSLDDTTATPATGAEITLQLDEQPVDYHPMGDSPGQYAPDTAMVVPADAEFALTAQWQGQTATVSGTVPRPLTIEDVQVDVPREPVEAILVDSLRRDSLDIPAEQGYIYPIEVTVSWSADFPGIEPDSTYWIRTQLKPYEFSSASSTVVDYFLQPEEVFRESTAPRSDGRRHWTGVYAVPVDEDDDPLPEHQLRVSLVRSGAEYAAFATSRDDPERREPISNVQGGIGIAAAIALDSTRVAVESDEASP